MLSRSSSMPNNLNFCLAAMHVLLNLYQFFILPIYFLPTSMWWGLILVPIAALNNSFWALIHEAIHDLFNPSNRFNLAAGRLLSIFFGAPFRVLRLSHLLHHRFNRSPLEGTEVYNPEVTSRIRASVGYYFQILGGLNLLEILSPLPFMLPRSLLHRFERAFSKRNGVGGSLAKNLVRDEAIREVRTDGIAVFIFLGLSAICYGEHWELLVGVLMARGFFISFLDNVYHYRTPINDVSYAYNLWLPQLVSKILLNFNLHGVHHKNPTLPWIDLPQLFAQQSERFDDNYFGAAIRQLSGPVPLSELGTRE